MKTQARGTARSSGFTGLESNAFTIAVNSKSFKILLDTLYTNKIRAFIRELWTNAFDSHVEAGTPTLPFDCYLPNALSPTFTVRDYGVSMDHESVMHRYTNVFDSPKDERNDLVGCLGLGSKSPFAYTDAFTVTAWLDGWERQYLCAIGADGIPQITALPPTESDEAQGFQVSFPVEERHFQECRSEALEVAKGFDTPPNVAGLRLDQDVPVLQGDGWAVRNGYSGNGVRQGCVIYPIHNYQVPVVTNLNGQFGVTVDVPIGSVDVAANREALSLDDDTIVNVQSAFARAAGQIQETARFFVLCAPDLFEAQRRFLDMEELTGHALGAPLKYNGTVLDGKITFDFKDAPVVLDYTETPQSDRLSFHVRKLSGLQFIVRRTNAAPVPRQRTRFRSYRQAWKHNTANLLILVDPTPRQLSALVRRLHLRGDQIIAESALPDVRINRGPRGQGGLYVPGVYTAIASTYKNGNRDQYQYVRTVDFDAKNDDYLWVGIERITAEVSVDGVGHLAASTAHGLIGTAAKTMGVTVPIYYMTEGARKRFKAHDDDEFVTVLKKWVSAHAAPILKAEHLTTVAKTVRSHAREVLGEKVVNKLCAEVGRAAYSATGIDTSCFIARLLSTQLTATRNDAVTEASRIMKRYPLIFPNGRSESEILRYISECNKKG